MPSLTGRKHPSEKAGRRFASSEIIFVDASHRKRCAPVASLYLETFRCIAISLFFPTSKWQKVCSSRRESLQFPLLFRLITLLPTCKTQKKAPKPFLFATFWKNRGGLHCTRLDNGPYNLEIVPSGCSKVCLITCIQPSKWLKKRSL